jgi:dTDP-4-dehydrorhamnose reductase
MAAAFCHEMIGRMQRALLIGASGYLGRTLHARLGPGRSAATFHAHAVAGALPFDATRERLPALLARAGGGFSHVVLLHGLTNPDACAKDPAGTARVNVESMQALAADAMTAGLTPVFLSSDYVYDGTRGRRREDEPPCPTTEYGRQKAAVEQWLAAQRGPWLVARSSKIVGGELGTHSVLGPWVEEIRAGRELRCASDQVFSPASVDDVAGALVRLMETGATGLFNVAGPEALSRLALAQLLGDAVAAADPSVRPRITACSLRDIPFAEPRPLDTSLDTGKLQGAIGWPFVPMAELCLRVARAHFGSTA